MSETDTTNEVGQQIEQFIKNFDVKIHHIVVPTEKWEDVKEYAVPNGEDGFDKSHLIEGVPVRWSGPPQSDVEAVVKVTD